VCSQLALFCEELRATIAKNIQGKDVDQTIFNETMSQENTVKHVVVRGRGQTSNNRLVTFAYDQLTRMPSTRPRTVFTNYVCAIIDPSQAFICVGLALCKVFNKKQGCVLQLPHGATLPSGDFLLRTVGSMGGFDRGLVAALQEIGQFGSFDAVTPAALRRLLCSSTASTTGEGFVQNSALAAEIGKLPSNHAAGQFNEEQKKALAVNALTVEGTVIIQGPPGTGKSHLLAKGIIPQMLGNRQRVLVICNSNAALDEILTKVNDQQTYGPEELIRAGYKCGELVQHYFVADKDLKGELFLRQQSGKGFVVFTTIHQATKLRENLSNVWCFDAVVVDEAGVVLPRQVAAALLRCGSDTKKLILVGDHKQLPPIFKSNDIHPRSVMEQQLQSFNDRKGSDSDVVHVMLCEQWRMAPLIRELVSKMSYDDMLRDSGAVERYGPKSGSILHGHPLLVINITGSQEHYNQDIGSYQNEREAEILQCMVALFERNYEELCGHNVQVGTSSSIITSFHAQRRLLAKEIVPCEAECVQTFTGQSSNLDELSPEEKKRLEAINTVHAFQGAESGINFFSSVRDGKRAAKSVHNNNQKQLLNVAISRAKHLVVIVGSIEDLAEQGRANEVENENENYWGTVFEFVRENGIVINIEVDPDTPVDEEATGRFIENELKRLAGSKKRGRTENESSTSSKRPRYHRNAPPSTNSDKRSVQRSLYPM
jgi:hypothetical protein